MNSFVKVLIQPILEAEGQKGIALVPGGFKPPTVGHFALVDEVAKNPNFEKVIVLIGHKNRDGVSKEESKEIWDIYKKYLPSNVEIKTAENSSPISDVASMIKNNPDTFFYPVVGIRGEMDLGDLKRFDSLEGKYPNFKTIVIRSESSDDRVSGTNTRAALIGGEKERFQSYLPAQLSQEEKDKVWSILTKTPLDEVKYAEPSEYDYPPLIKSLTEFMLNKGMNLRPLPKVKFVNDDVENARDFFGKTAYYDPNNRVIVLYTMDRHPKDVMRSYAHEMIHHMQNCDNRLGNITTQNTNEEGDLPEIEREAYEKGNMMFRGWTDTITEDQELNENILDKIKEKSTAFFDALKSQKKDLEGFGPLLKKYLKDKNSLTPEEKTKLKRNTTDIAKMSTLPVLGISGTTFLGAITKGKSLPSQFREKLLEADDSDALSYPSTFKPGVNILVVFKENENYPNLKSYFDEYGYGFYYPKDKTIIIDGERFVNSDLDFNDLKFVEAHEVTHLLLGHTGPYSEDDEMDADLGAYILLTNKGLPTDKLVKEFKNRHGVPFTEDLLQRVNSMNSLNENVDSEYTIYCDMDGVLCDFDKGYEDLTKMSTAKANTYPKSFFWNFFRKKLGKTPERIFWSNLPPQPGGPELWKFIAPYKPNILSAPAIDFKLSQDQQLDPKYNEAIIGKKEWIDKNLHNVGEEIFVPAVQKAKFAAPNHILIDDMEKNITAWEAAGGIGILHKNATDTINTLKEKYGFNER
jgi:phosphopantetheine adenylyltransferase/Zn-dependent peptidase ImmA (M78 family)